MWRLYCHSIIIIFMLASGTAKAGKEKMLLSPDGKLSISFNVTKNTLVYNIRFKKKLIVFDSPLGLIFKQTAFTDNLRIIKTVFSKGVEEYDLAVGKASHVSDNYNQLLLTLQQIQSPSLQIQIEVRAFKTGIAFRYKIPQWQGSADFTLLQENTFFILANNPKARALLLPNYTTSHEGVYSKEQVNSIPSGALLDMPALFEFPDDRYMAITEAALVNHAAMYLSKCDSSNKFVSKLSPWPSDTSIKVKSSLPHNSPWRVFLISDRIGDLIESNIITSLNEPCKINDLSWLHPGKTTFPWWNGNVLPDTINAPGNNFVTAQYYIDFCARNNIEYHSVVEYGLHQWYTDDGVGFQPGPNADVTKPVPGLNMKEICDYAKSKGVGVRVWVHWAALYPKLDSAFALFEKWGLSGMMVDFMDRDDQQMVNMQNEILEKAARHQLHIQFHGAYKPTGLHRTWPNEFTREGTLNYEANKWANYITPDMDIDIPFTRMLAGSTDYHLGGFRAVPASEIKPNYTRPLMLGTRCHMLAMYVVLENYLQMVCDYPEAYEEQPGFEFIRQIPTTWEQTKVLDAKAGEYIVMARKKNNEWYIGAITNNNSRKLSLSFQFLGEDNYEATLYTDANDAAVHPNKLNKQTIQLNKNSRIDITLAPGGGTAIRLVKK